MSQIWENILLIAEVLYSRYQIIYIFDNIKNYVIFIIDVFLIINISKKLE